MAIHSTGNFAELLYPGLAKIWGHEYNEYETLYTQFFDIMKSDQAFEKEQGVTTLPVAGIKDEGDEISFQQMYQGFQKEYKHLTYALGLAVTREMVEDDKYNYISQGPKFLAKSMRELEEIVHTNILNNGFTAGFTGADGQTLFSTSHPLVAGGTFSNRPTVAADLSETSMEDAVIAVGYFRDDQNKRINAKVKGIVVPTDLRFVATKILETKYNVGTNNNDVNVISNMGIKPVITNYLTDTDAWFLVTDVPNGLRGYVRREAEVERFNDDRTQNLNIVSTKRFSAGWTDPRGVYGSPGA